MNQRAPREHDPAYLGWIAKLPCAACLARGKITWGVHVAHLRAKSLEHGKRETGMQEKPGDMWTTPLCPSHHVNGNKSQHHMGEEVFWADLGINPFDLCLSLNSAFTNGLSGWAVISRFAALATRNRTA